MILAFTMASSAFPLDHVTQVPSWLKLDVLKRFNEGGAPMNSTVSIGNRDSSTDATGRGKDVSIDIARRVEQSNQTVDIAKRGDEHDAIHSPKLAIRLNASVFVA